MRPKINRVPTLIIHNIHEVFERYLAKTVVCIMPIKLYNKDRMPKMTLTFHPISIWFGGGGYYTIIMMHEINHVNCGCYVTLFIPDTDP